MLSCVTEIGTNYRYWAVRLINTHQFFPLFEPVHVEHIFRHDFFLFPEHVFCREPITADWVDTLHLAVK